MMVLVAASPGVTDPLRGPRWPWFATQATGAVAGAAPRAHRVGGVTCPGQARQAGRTRQGRGQ
jgi:hypothetical protein